MNIGDKVLVNGIESEVVQLSGIYVVVRDEHSVSVCMPDDCKPVKKAAAKKEK